MFWIICESEISQFMNEMDEKQSTKFDFEFVKKSVELTITAISLRHSSTKLNNCQNH